MWFQPEPEMDLTESAESHIGRGETFEFQYKFWTLESQIDDKCNWRCDGKKQKKFICEADSTSLFEYSVIIKFCIYQIINI